MTAFRPSLHLTDIAAALTSVAIAIAAFWHVLGLSTLVWDVPIVYTGDAFPLFYLYDLAGRGADGVPSATGMPFGTQVYDAPGAEAFNLGLIRLLDLATGDFATAFNLYFLATIVLVGVSAYAVGRALGLERKWAMLLSVLFNLMPFHASRIVHLFLTNYMPAALLAWLVFGVIGNSSAGAEADRRRAWLVCGCAILCGCCGLYYAFFSCLFIGFALALEALRHGNLRPVTRQGWILGVIVATVIVCMLPSFVYLWSHGINPDVAHRKPGDTELVGLKLTQMLLPIDSHRLTALAQLRRNYEQHTPLNNENNTATLGIFGALGLLLLLAAPVLGRWRESLPELVRKAAPLTWLGFAYATIGGLGSLVAWLITPQFRSLNRVSVFLGFFALLGVAALLQQWCRRVRPTWVPALIAVSIGALGVLDVTPALGGDAGAFRQSYRNDADFAQRAEQMLPQGAMVFQLPFVAYPEALDVEKLGGYEHLAPVLQARRLRWTFGAMAGRAEGFWYQWTAELEPDELAEVLRDAGFQAIEINRKGYADRGAQIEQNLTRLGWRAAVTSTDANLVLYIMPTPIGTARMALAVAPGAIGWQPLESFGDGAGMWSRGRSEIDIANVAATRASCMLELGLRTLSARKIRLLDGNATLAEVDLAPSLSVRGDSAPAVFRAQVTLRAGESKRLWLQSDAPAELVDGREQAFFWQLPNALLCR